MKTERLSIRVTPEIKKDLEEMSSSLGMSPADLLSSLVLGLSKTWRDEGEITIPYRVVPEKRYLKFIKGLSVVTILLGVASYYFEPQGTVQVGASLISVVKNFMAVT